MRGKVIRTVMMIALMGGGAYLLYAHGLSETAKSNLREAITTVKKACEQICETVSRAEGYSSTDDGPLPNRKRTEDQWEALGF